MNEHLFRSRDERVIAGVAGGLAERLDLDPALVRIVWLLLVPLTGGFALLVYIVMAIVVPDEDRAWMPYTGSAPWTGTPPAPDAAGATTPTTAGPAAGLPGATTPPSWASGTPNGPAYVPPTMDRHS